MYTCAPNLTGKVVRDSGNLFLDDGHDGAGGFGRPDPFVNAQDFSEAIEAGAINLKHVENCHACVLKVGSFYIQRPSSGSDHQLNVVCVKKIIYCDGGSPLQWGAWTQAWELATSGDEAACFISDPWVASALQRDGQRYDASKDMSNQGWTYEISALAEFQDEVTMNTQWTKPKGKPIL